MLNFKSFTLGLMLLVALSGVDAGALHQRLQRRDVSHLPLEYLPPVVLPPLPSREYLPPVEQHAASLPHVLQPPRDYLPPPPSAASEELAPVENLKLSNAYLPPFEEEQQTEEAITTTEEPATTTTATPTTTQQTELEQTEPPVEVKTSENLEEHSGVLHDDGYHYATPKIIADLTPAALSLEAFLPPLNDNEVVEEEPQSEESAALLDDGYHYRTIRRLKL